MRLALVVVSVLALGCMCGSTPDASVPPVPVDAEPVTAPTPTAPPTRGTGWSASIQGVCQMESDCGCLEKASVGECAASLQRSVAVFTPDVLGCIVTQSCEAMCGGGGVACVKQGAARQSAQLRADHDVTMGIINNFPNGGPCANGQTMVTDSSGNFLRCQ